MVTNWAPTETVSSGRPHRRSSTFPPTSIPINLHLVTPAMGWNAGIGFPSKPGGVWISSPRMGLLVGGCRDGIPGRHCCPCEGLSLHAYACMYAGYREPVAPAARPPDALLERTSAGASFSCVHLLVQSYGQNTSHRFRPPHCSAGGARPSLCTAPVRRLHRPTPSRGDRDPDSPTNRPKLTAGTMVRREQYSAVLHGPCHSSASVVPCTSLPRPSRAPVADVPCPLARV